MTPEEAAALRKPFPSGAIGKLPKPYSRDSAKGNCKECGGYHGLPAVHLDYVGHGATTDRLLTVDPEWSWEPFAINPDGLPALDRNGNLWIRLTICGVTRIGVGDGSSLKEIIGDAIRNAAMRFGVALDLWSKEELEQSHGPATPTQRPTPAPKPKPAAAAPGDDAWSDPWAEPVPPPPPDYARPAPVGGNGEKITDRQLGMLQASFTSAGVTDRDVRLNYCRKLIGRDDITTSKDLTKREASKVIEALSVDSSGRD